MQKCEVTQIWGLGKEAGVYLRDSEVVSRLDLLTLPDLVILMAPHN